VDGALDLLGAEPARDARGDRVSARAALASGLARVRRSWGLGVVVLVTNVAAALLLAAPLLATLRAELRERPAAGTMRHGFDYQWWSHRADTTHRLGATLGPDLLGSGFAFKNVDLLLKGQVPAALFAQRDEEGKRTVLLHPLLLGLGVAYMALQAFLAGGILAVLRQTQGRWTMRALLHGSGFYFGRFARIALLMLLVLAVVFALYGPFARWADAQAREAVSERTATAWALGRHLLLLITLLLVHLVGTCARVITVLEERQSAVLAVLSALAFTAANAGAAAVLAAAAAALSVGALLLWLLFDHAWNATGYASLAVTLAAMQALVLARIWIRLALAGSLLDLYRGRTIPPSP
jgi:hypothetical protein